MKRVIIVRHAKAVPYGYDDDFNRYLRDRGINDAVKISEQIKKLNILPGILISSPALRALKTAQIFAETFHYPENNILKIDNLYGGISTDEFIDIIHTLPEEIDTVFFFGHNPTFYYLVNNMLNFFDGDMPTCSTVSITYDTDDWKEVQARQGKKEIHLVPRMFKNK